MPKPVVSYSNKHNDFPNHSIIEDGIGSVVHIIDGVGEYIKSGNSCGIGYRVESGVFDPAVWQVTGSLIKEVRVRQLLDKLNV